MKVTILTLFPEMFIGPFDHSIIRRAKERGLVKIELLNIRDFATDKHKTVDDRPYGGGVGMVLRVDVIDRAIQFALGNEVPPRTRLHLAKRKRVILLDPQGKVFNQEKAKKLAKFDHLILICGHYEGVDERVRKLVDEEISVGDYILTGGEIPSMVVVETVTRLLPQVLPKAAVKDESFAQIAYLGKKTKVLEPPTYTRPPIYKNRRVPKILFSGNHQEIEKWQKTQAILRTKKRRPDLFKEIRLS